MVEVNIHEAKAHLSKLLARVAMGEEVMISRAGKPVARLVSVDQKMPRRIPDRDKGAGFIADDFDDPLPRDLLIRFLK